MQRLKYWIFQFSICAKYYGTDITKTIDMAYLKFDKNTPESDVVKPPVIILHSLFGSKANWQTLGPVLNKLTGRTVFAVDTRNHGDSPHTKEFSYQLMADDVYRFMLDRSINLTSLIGHSMGGRVAMLTALTHENLVEKLIVEDISPHVTRHHPAMMLNYIRILRMVKLDKSLPLHKARKIAAAEMATRIKNKGTIQFMLSSLEKTEDGTFRWRFNLDSLEENFKKKQMNFPEYIKKCEVPALFIAGIRSDYVTKSEQAKIVEVFPNAIFKYLNTGHWVHSEKPKEFIQFVKDFLNE